MCPAGMHRELCEGVWAAADDDGGVVRRPLVAKVRPELFSSTLGHEILPTIARLARDGASRRSSSGTGEWGWIPARWRSDSSQRA